jgi:hypothetical protein
MERQLQSECSQVERNGSTYSLWNAIMSKYWGEMTAAIKAGLSNGRIVCWLFAVLGLAIMWRHLETTL